MNCLYCNKRLWLHFSQWMHLSKKPPFCSKTHEATYHAEMSAMRRLVEYTVPFGTPAIPVRRSQKLSQNARASGTPVLPPVVVPPLGKFVVEWSRPKPIPPPPAATVLLEAAPFAGPIQFPSGNIHLIAITLDSVTEPAQELAAIPNPRIAVCRVQSPRRRRVPQQSPVAFSSRAHRRRLR